MENLLGRIFGATGPISYIEGLAIVRHGNPFLPSKLRSFAAAIGKGVGKITSTCNGDYDALSVDSSNAVCTSDAVAMIGR